MELTEIKLNENNPREIKDSQFDKLKNSIKSFEKMLELRPMVVDENNVLLGGNMRYRALQALGYTDIPDKWVTRAEGLTDEQKKEFIIKDNVGYGEWDWDTLLNEWDTDQLQEWGLDLPVWDTPINDETEEEEYLRKKKEFEERIARGEIDSDDEEYNEFLDKFATKHTTDDCYTPTLVYDAVEKYVENHYHLNKVNFVRPFYPNGDYTKEKYKADSVVVDNPPFSILADIVKWYQERKIKFFLFCPTLTMFGGCGKYATSIVTGNAITYANKAHVNTSFLTNLEDPRIAVKSEPELYKMVKEANDENLKQITKQLPKYEYDKHVVTSPMVAQYSRMGVVFSFDRGESVIVSAMDEQKKDDKAIFGGGYLISDKVFGLRKQADKEKELKEKELKEKEMKEKEIIYKLSEREKAIIAELNEYR